MEQGDTIVSAILDAIATANRSRTEQDRLAVAPDAPLYGRGSSLDSLGLVSLLFDVEDNLRRSGIDVSLSDEQAMSQRTSPFRDVPSLAAFIAGRIQR